MSRIGREKARELKTSSVVVFKERPNSDKLQEWLGKVTGDRCSDVT